jgi:hypothetical protein
MNRLARNALVCLALAFLLSLSFILRSSDFKNVSAARNIEATYHVLLTNRALGENPASDHYFLPTVTLGGVQNAHVSWGATIPTASGDYLYTSFTPPTFLVVHAFDLLTKGPLQLADLAKFNMGLGIVSALLLALLAFQITRYLNADRNIAAVCVIFSVMIAIFSREALQSFGVIYWAHSLYQIVLIPSLILSFALLRKPDAASSLLQGALLLFVFLGAWMEWTGYVFGGGLALVLSALNRLEGRSSRFPVLVASMLVLAGVVTIGHYALAAGLGETLNAFANRFFARSIAKSPGIVAFGQGYVLSYGGFLLAVLIAGASVINSARRGAFQAIDHSRARVMGAVIVLALVPLAENLLMMQHATEFTFDRLKFIPLAVILLVTASVMAGPALRTTLFAVLLVSSAWGNYAYRADIMAYDWFDSIDRDNQALAVALAKATDDTCTRYTSNTNVRAYLNLLFDQSIVEGFRDEGVAGVFRNKDICSIIVLAGSEGSIDMPKLTGATVYDRSGTSIVFEVVNGTIQRTPKN